MIRYTRTRAYGDKRVNPPPPSTPSTLEALAHRLARLAPSHCDPERFHMDKAELVGELRRLARALEVAR